VSLSIEHADRRTTRVAAVRRRRWLLPTADVDVVEIRKLGVGRRGRLRLLSPMTGQRWFVVGWSCRLVRVRHGWRLLILWYSVHLNCWMRMPSCRYGQHLLRARETLNRRRTKNTHIARYKRSPKNQLMHRIVTFKLWQCSHYSGVKHLLPVLHTNAFMKASMCTAASIPPKELGAIPPPKTEVWGRSFPAGSRDRAPVGSGAKPAETVENL